MVKSVGEAHAFEQARRPLFLATSIHAACQEEWNLDIFNGRKVRHQVERLKDKPYLSSSDAGPFVRRGDVELLAIPTNSPLRWCKHAAQYEEKRTLAAAAGTGHGNEVAFLDFKRHPPQRPHNLTTMTIVLADVFYLQH